MWQHFSITLTVVIKKFYYFLLFKNVIKMYKNFQKILKCILATPGLELLINWLPARCLRPLGHINLVVRDGEKPIIYYSESYHQSLLKLQAKTIVLTGANLVHDSFWLMFLALQRVLLKDRFHHFYKLLPFFSFSPSYQNLLETDNNPNPHWLLFSEGFYDCFTIPGIQG